MRQIGHLVTEANANRFANYLYTEGIHSRLERERDGTYAVWVLDEDQLERARILLERFQQDPMALVFLKGAAAADQSRERDAAAEKAAERRQHGRGQLIRAAERYGVGPLTLLLIAVSVAATLLSDWGNERNFMRDWSIVLPLVQKGEVWRLVSPIFLHFSVIHLVFDMIWLYDLGTMIEARRGTLKFGLLVTGLAVISNLGQYYFSGPNFGGMSGVVYGLLGFVWLRGKTDPGSGLFLHPQTVAMMIIWFFICFSPYVGQIANAAHAFGLGTGMLAGYVSGLLARHA